MTARVSVPSEEAFDFVEGSADAPVFITCEHASERLFEPYVLAGRDARLVGTHWAFDPGAAELTRELAAALDAPAVLARFSRLIVDPNRPEDSPTLLRDIADDEPVHLNLHVKPDDRAARIARFHAPFHRAIDLGVARCAAPLIFPVHTFTDDYQGEKRSMELGVLFDTEDELAESLRFALASAGFVVAMNEPWSGKDGLIYSGERHARAHGRRVLELETRQDRAIDAAFRARLVPVLARFLRESRSRLATSDARP